MCSRSIGFVRTELTTARCQRPRCSLRLHHQHILSIIYTSHKTLYQRWWQTVSERFLCRSVPDTLPAEITPDLLDGVAAVHLDSRHTLAAIVLATFANERYVPIFRSDRCVVEPSQMRVLGHCAGGIALIKVVTPHQSHCLARRRCYWLRARFFSLLKTASYFLLPESRAWTAQQACIFSTSGERKHGSFCVYRSDVVTTACLHVVEIKTRLAQFKPSPEAC